MGANALAQDHIRERAWFEDPSGQLDWHAVKRQNFQDYTGLLSKGFGRSVIWLRLRIDPTAHSVSSQDPTRLILRIRPVYLDDIQVYDPDLSQGLVGVTGDLHHPRNQELQGLDFLLPIARGTQARDIWLRLSSKSTRQIDVQAVNLSDLNHQTHLQSLLFATYVGLVLLLAAWGLVRWLFSHELLMGVFGLSQLLSLGFALFTLGHMRLLWPVNWSAWLLDLGNSIFAASAVSSAVLFHILLISEFNPPPGVQRLFKVFLALLPVKLGMMALGWTSEALQLNMTEVLLMPLVFLVSVLNAKGWEAASASRPALSRRVVILFYSLLVFTLALAALPGLGWLKGSEIGLYLVQVHGLIAALWILLMLQYRSNVQTRQQHDTMMALERSQLLIQQERNVREAQDQLLAMLAHELKTPLATMQMRLDQRASGSDKILKAIRDMNSVIDRCQQTAQFSDRRLQVQNHDCDLQKLLSDAVASSPQPERIRLQSPETLPLRTDPQLLFIVLTNLLENACKYAAPDSAITLTLHASGSAGACVVRVSNLPGPADWPDAKQVFTKYYRSPHARRQAGTGLGLYLVSKLVQALGGTIEYAPDQEQIHFVLRLPASIPDGLPN